MCSGGSNTPQRVLGFPIRTSTDRRLVDTSPWLFAVAHVLHRFLAPRHPPLALCSLEEQRCSCLLCSSQRASPASGSWSVFDDRAHAHLARRGSGAVAHTGREGYDSLKTEEKTKPADSSSSGGEPTTLERSRLTRQCTNWELVLAGSNICRASTEQCSLERR